MFRYIYICKTERGLKQLNVNYEWIPRGWVKSEWEQERRQEGEEEKSDNLQILFFFPSYRNWRFFTEKATFLFLVLLESNLSPSIASVIDLLPLLLVAEGYIRSSELFAENECTFNGLLLEMRSREKGTVTALDAPSRNSHDQVILPEIRDVIGSQPWNTTKCLSH